MMVSFSLSIGLVGNEVDMSLRLAAFSSRIGLPTGLAFAIGLLGTYQPCLAKSFEAETPGSLAAMKNPKELQLAQSEPGDSPVPVPTKRAAKKGSKKDRSGDPSTPVYTPHVKKPKTESK